MFKEKIRFLVSNFSLQHNVLYYNAFNPNSRVYELQLQGLININVAPMALDKTTKQQLP